MVKISKSLIFIKKNLVQIIALLLTVPTIVVWSFSGVSYLWSLIYKYILVSLSPTGQVFLLLIIPFLAFVASVLSYLKTKEKLPKILIIINLLSIILVIAASFIIGG